MKTTPPAPSNAVPIANARAAFYYEHWKLIEEWSHLHEDADSAVTAWLEGRMTKIAQDLAGTLATSKVPVEVVPTRGVDGGPMVVLTRTAWLTTDGEPRVGIGIGLHWKRNYRSFVGDEPPYVGIYVSPGRGSAAVRKAVLARPRLPGPWEEDNQGPWVIWRPMPATDQFWEDLRPYERRVRTQITKLWGQYAPTIDKAKGSDRRSAR